MPVITIFSGSYCHGDEVARALVQSLGYALVDDQALVAQAAQRFQTDEGKLLNAMTGKTSVFNKFTHDKERSLAILKGALAEALKQDNLLFSGFAGHLIPRGISHVLKVCLIADVKLRAASVANAEGLAEKEGLKRIHREDESRVRWVEYLFSQADPWNPGLYDMVIPMDKTSVEEAVRLVRDNAGKSVLQVTEASRRAVDDFILAAQVDMALAKEGHDVTVTAEKGDVKVVINKHVLMLASLEDELKRLAGAVPGVRSVETKVGPGYYQRDIYRKFEFDVPVPRKVLLVDDEREFAQTLSERLQMRDLDSAVVFDGEAALSVVAEDEPEVMVLDLKMPGVDGIEVLKRVKAEHPDVEVIVLTGHGSKEIEELCLELGACAYLEKPVDIETLTKTMQEAYRKLRERKQS